MATVILCGVRDCEHNQDGQCQMATVVMLGVAAGWLRCQARRPKPTGQTASQDEAA